MFGGDRCPGQILSSWRRRETEVFMNRAKLFLAALAVIGGSVGFAGAAPKNDYRVTILVSNEAGEAPVQDRKLVNAWGVAASPTGAWWVANNGTSSSTLYTGGGAKIGLEVPVPGVPTGEVYNGGGQFLLANGSPALFLWASEDGTLSGWNSGTLAQVVFPKSGVGEPGSNYKGLAIRGNTLYTTDFGECKVESLDGTFTEFDTAGEFDDPTIPTGYCPFGIQAIGDSIFVTYALKSGADDVGGQGHGFVREFDADGHPIASVATHRQLNSPWGVAMAPADFGRFGGCLLVGNFGDGRINAYCKNEGG